MTAATLTGSPHMLKLLQRLRRQLYLHTIYKKLLVGFWITAWFWVAAAIAHHYLAALPLAWILFSGIIPPLLIVLIASYDGPPSLEKCAIEAGGTLNDHALLVSALEQGKTTGPQRSGAASFIIDQAETLCQLQIKKVLQSNIIRWNSLPMVMGVMGIGIVGLQAPGLMPHLSSELPANSTKPAQFNDELPSPPMLKSFTVPSQPNTVPTPLAHNAPTSQSNARDPDLNQNNGHQAIKIHRNTKGTPPIETKHRLTHHQDEGASLSTATQLQKSGKNTSPGKGDGHQTSSITNAATATQTVNLLTARGTSGRQPDTDQYLFDNPNKKSARKGRHEKKRAGALPLATNIDLNNTLPYALTSLQRHYIANYLSITDSHPEKPNDTRMPVE